MWWLTLAAAFGADLVIPVTGVLHDPGGLPRNGTFAAEFVLRAGPLSSDAERWRGTLPLTFVDGRFAAVLGPDPGLVPTDFASDAWITIAVAGSSESSPVLIGHAARAGYAEVAGALASPLPWSGLSGIPAGFADGVDADTTYTAGAGLQLGSGAFSIPAKGVTEAMVASGAAPAGRALVADGAGGASFTSVPWSALSGIPAGFADGTDASNTYTASNGLALSGSAFSLAGSATGNFVFDNYAQGSDGFGVRAASGRSLWIMPDRCQGCSNGITQIGDTTMIFTQGTIGTGNLVIAPWASGVKGLRMTADGTVGIGKAVPTSTLDVDGTVTATNLSTTTPWVDFLAASGWTHYDAKCRVVNGWVELRGRSDKTLGAGWPVEQPVLLPAACRPQTARYTEMPCHGSGSPRNIVCNNDFQTDGRVSIHTDHGTIQQRWEGVRIWGGP